MLITKYAFIIDRSCRHTFVLEKKKRDIINERYLQMIGAKYSET